VATRILRSVAFFLGHLLTAVITTEIFTEELAYVFHASTIRGMLHKEYALNVIFAFALGYFVYYKWHSEPAKWIWVVGVLWFLDRALAAARPLLSLDWRAQFWCRPLPDVWTILWD
jgi:hypothetical protein